MRLMLWTLCFIGLALWTLVAWGAAGLLGFAEAWVPASAVDPLGIGLTVTDLADWLGAAGTGIVIAVWAAGALLLVAATFVLGRALRLGGRLMRGRGGSTPHLPRAMRR